MSQTLPPRRYKKSQSTRFCGFFISIIRRVKKFLKLIIGLFLLPLCWSGSRALFFLLTETSANASSGWALPAGFLVSVLGFFLLPQAFRTYVLGHELSHAIAGLLMGAKVGKMKVGRDGGHVELSKSNFATGSEGPRGQHPLLRLPGFEQPELQLLSTPTGWSGVRRGQQTRQLSL